MSKDLIGKKLLIIAGGTGGHIFPALAVAEFLAERGVQIYWLGSDVGLEKTLVPPHFPLSTIAARRLRGKGWQAYLSAPWQLIKSTWQALQIIKTIRPDAVLAMGGFVSGPGGVAAKLSGAPLIVHEQNAIAGYTNRILAKFADAVVAAYPGVFSRSNNAKAVGNPVRHEIAAIPPPAERLAGRDGKLRILILGGSQGAQAINRLIATFAGEYPGAEQHLEIWHQTGQRDFPAIQALYQPLAVSAKVQPFIDDMAAAYQWADVLVGRSGALTVAEITAAGVASILTPFPAAVDDHQWHNARYLEEAGAAKIIREADLTVPELAAQINSFVQNRALLLTMAQRARHLAQPRAAEAVAEIVVQRMQ